MVPTPQSNCVARASLDETGPLCDLVRSFSPQHEGSMSSPVDVLPEREVATPRHRLAYPAFPAEVAKASRETRRAMRWPIMLTASFILLALTGTLAVLLLLRPASAATALLICGAALLFRTRHPGKSYDHAVGWVYRYGILAGIAGELASQTMFRAGGSPIPSSLMFATDALGVGGAIGLGVALASSASVVVLTFLQASASLRHSAAESL